MTEPMNNKKQASPTFRQQIKNILPTLLMSGVISLGGVTLTVLIARLTGNPLWKLTKDPAQIIGHEPYIGLLSNWGVLLWFASAVICLFTEMLLKKNGAVLKARLFLFVSGILSLVLALDDLFLLHDEILPQAFGIPEFFFYFMYLVTIILYIAIFLREISRKEYILFWTAILFLFISRGFFFILPFLREYKTSGDMLKYIGIVFWLAFFYRAALKEISSMIDNKNTAR